APAAAPDGPATRWSPPLAPPLEEGLSPAATVVDGMGDGGGDTAGAGAIAGGSRGASTFGAGVASGASAWAIGAGGGAGAAGTRGAGAGASRFVKRHRRSTEDRPPASVDPLAAPRAGAGSGTNPSRRSTTSGARDSSRANETTTRAHSATCTTTDTP